MDDGLYIISRHVLVLIAVGSSGSGIVLQVGSLQLLLTLEVAVSVVANKDALSNLSRPMRSCSGQPARANHTTDQRCVHCGGAVVIYSTNCKSAVQSFNFYKAYKRAVREFLYIYGIVLVTFRYFQEQFSRVWVLKKSNLVH